MDLLWTILLVFLVCAQAQNITEVRVELGQNVILNCSGDNLDTYWYMQIHRQVRGSISRTFLGDSASTQYYIYSVRPKYSAFGNSLTIINITADDCRLYFCARRQNDNIQFVDTFSLVADVPVTAFTNICAENDQQQQRRMGVIYRCVVLSVFFVSVIILSCQKVLKCFTGEDVLLPCVHKGRDPPPKTLSVFWRDTDNNPVVDIKNNKPHYSSQHEKFRGRVESFPDLYKDGNFSIILKKVQQSDNGTYECHVPAVDVEQRLTLSVLKNVTTLRSVQFSVLPAGPDNELDLGPVSSFLFSGTNILVLLSLTAVSCQKVIKCFTGEDVLLPCVYKGRDPPPETLSVFWRDTDNNPVLDIKNNKPHYSSQHQKFRGRVESFPDLYKDGNFSIILKKVQQSDNGTYECHVPAVDVEQRLTLSVLKNVTTLRSVQFSVLPAGPDNELDLGPVSSFLFSNSVTLGSDAELVSHPAPHRKSQSDRLKFVIHITTTVSAVSCQADVTGFIGDDVLLPCTCTQVNSAVFWRDKNDSHILNIIQNKPDTLSQDQKFKGRVESFPDQYVNGNFSILLKKVQQTDSGPYYCLVPEVDCEQRVQLIVSGERAAAATTPAPGSSAHSPAVSLNFLRLLLLALFGCSFN
ncbi:hypothetical protein Q5P01_005971 [Channa striata]|uniref:Ig-like domain-containing protein n=1 Tax=Channa striata TaxID=64152 RepID=A0AA88NKC2_CHASR|nr:hypothetical protein Q5P01_005971 [Channa striata]